MEMANEFLTHFGLSCLSGTVAILLVYLVCRFVPRLPGAVRVCLWWIVCLKLILGLAPIPIPSVPVLPNKAPAFVAPLTADQPSPIGNTDMPPSTTDTETSASVADTDTSTDTEPEPAPFPIATVLSLLWLIGVGVCIGMQLMALVQLRRLILGATQQESAVLTEAAQRAGLRSVPKLWITTSPIEPLTVGMFRPSILLSQEDLKRLSSTELLPILAHECVHIRRGDLYLSLIPWLAQTLFWFLPPVYLAMREFELAREAACDQQTLAALALQPRVYGELLVKLSSPVSPLPVPSSAMALSAGFTHLKRRIEMLDIKPYQRRLFLVTALLAAAVLVPWRLTVAVPAFPSVPLKNLDFSHGLQEWYRFANGSNTDAHPFYSVGVDKNVKRNGKATGFVAANPNIADDSDGDGGVLRYDIDGKKYRGKRIRWTSYLLGTGVKKKAFLFAAVDQPNSLIFAESPQITPSTTGWVKRVCVVDVPKDGSWISLGVRLEGPGSVHGSGFQMEVVDKSVPLSKFRNIKQEAQQQASEETEAAIKNLPSPQNLTFASGLDSWWNDDPTHTADTDYTMALDTHGGRNGGPAAYLKNNVANPGSYGTIAQNATPGPYLGKRIRLSAYLKTEAAKEGALWIVVHDEDMNKGSGANGESTGKVLKGTQGWTRIEHVLDIPTTTKAISFGINSEGAGKVWVDGFQIEVLGPAQ